MDRAAAGNAALCASPGSLPVQSGPITVNSHINTNNPQQAQQGFQTAATGGTLGSGLQGIGLNYVPGSAVRSLPFGTL